VPLVVSIPGGEPTGQASNPTSGFAVSKGGTSQPALFIFVSESGHITGWNPAVGSVGGATSTQAQDAIRPTGGVYKGVALGINRSGAGRLFAANFSTGQVEVYGPNWGRIRNPGAFHDPLLPKGYGPFNIMVSGNRVYVAYAKQSGGTDEVDGPGLGRLDVFTMHGDLIRRATDHSSLNAPWGLAIAPTGFGPFAGDLLVGNFGDGRIHVFNPAGLAERGTLRRPNGRPVTIDGLWALLPGNGTEAGMDQVIFTAGPADESHGLLGTLSAATG
jgi:uncharacterized protein (TIGR03118 family)